MPDRNDPTFSMWSQACDLIDQAERLHQRFFHLAASERPAASWAPPVDVYEDERDIVIVVAMPGVAPERMQVHEDGGTLVVRGQRPVPFAGSGRAVRQLEIPYGTFERRIALPAGRLELGSPEVMHGCLVLRLRKLDVGR